MLEDLLAWARSNGSEISSSVSFKNGDSGFGAVCTSSGPISIRVPSALIIRLENAVEHLGPDFGDLATKTRSINAVIKMFLARERAPAHLACSFFKPYIESLPANINSPYVWLAEDQKLLAGTNLGSSLRENLAELIEEWWLVVSVLPDSMEKPTQHYVNMKFYYEHKFYTTEDMHKYVTDVDVANWTSFPCYLWAAMIFKLRLFPAYLLQEESERKNEGKDIEKEGKTADQTKSETTPPSDSAMLVPVVDLLNHSPTAKVTWSGSGGFTLSTEGEAGQEIFNNYGQKGNEELLLAYGFCLETNEADSVALRIKVPPSKWDVLREHVKLPNLADYTTLVVPAAFEAPTPEKDLLFFIGRDRVPSNLVETFQWLVQNLWESQCSTPTIRMKLSGLNHLRQAMEAKSALLEPSLRASATSSSQNAKMVHIYVQAQKKLLDGGAKIVKRLEKAELAAHRDHLVSLKSVYKRDQPFARSLLVALGVASFDDIVNRQLQDQVWLLYLIRCFNKKEYPDSEESYLPEWLAKSFARMDKETEVAAEEVLQFRELYENIILPMNQAAPEIYNVGKWTVRELIVSTRLLDTIGFVRGRDQECILVQQEE